MQRYPSQNSRVAGIQAVTLFPTIRRRVALSNGVAEAGG